MATEITAIAPLRVLLIANYLADQQHSMLRYARLLEQGLRSAGANVTVLRPAMRLARWAKPGGKIAKFLGYVDKFGLFSIELVFKLRRFFRAGSGVVHLLDQGNGVYFALIARYPHLVTCHDLIVLKAGLASQNTQMPTPEPDLGHSSARLPGLDAPSQRLSHYQQCNWQSLKRTRWMVCVSEATKQDALRLLGVAPDRCVVIYNPLAPEFQTQTSDLGPANTRLAASTDAMGEITHDPYLLHVGSASFYKNRPGLLHIYSELRKQGCRLRLVIVGAPLNESEHILAERLGILALIQNCVDKSDAWIRAAYAQAEALIFPSLDEGFGWPILEALAQGCLVFTTNRRPMTEVGGTAARYFDPENPSEAAGVILATLTLRADPVVRSVLIAAGKVQAAQFTLEKFAQEYLDVYQRIALNPPLLRRIG